MPEYLAPGVYIEEIPSGNKPIQAASTSTAGFVGMAARGPANVPTLVTSQGGYNRVFGGRLNPLVYSDGRDALPYAVEGFFGNGGSRVYITRIVGPGASEAELALVAQSGVAATPVIVAQALAGDDELLLDDPGALAPGDAILISNGANSEMAILDDVAFVARMGIAGGLVNAYASGSTVVAQALTPVTGALIADLEEGQTEVELTAVTGITVGDILFLQDAGGRPTDHELVTVSAIDGLVLTLAMPLAGGHPQASTLNTFANGSPSAPTEADAGPSAAAVFVEIDTTGFSVGDLVLFDDGGGTTEVAVVTGLPEVVTLVEALGEAHPAGTDVVPAQAVLTLHAIWPGHWGDSLRATVSDTPIVETATVGVAPPNSTTLTLETAFGLFEGSVVSVAGTRMTVQSVDTDAGTVTMADPLAAEVPEGADVVSLEYGLSIARIGADGRVAEDEFFDRLALAPTHPRYISDIVGTWDAAEDRPSEAGASGLIRVEDTTTAATRLLPLVTGVGRMLDGGRDDVANVDETTYQGQDAIDPEDRTGIFAMKNRNDISICTVPGQTTVAVQKSLIAHCNEMAYRFAVLDTPLGSGLDAAKSHRQNFDTTRAAVYYPGLVIPDGFGPPGQTRVISPSGHVAGIYARTDITRGVHKAPANEVVRGVLGFEKVLSKGEQDVLNPVAVNCFRDFRTEFRGLRLYGARTATSDPEWRYVNVRRLFLFIEQSLDAGLQWAVFEPNAEPLWATVKQSVTNFLDIVWRSGALEGTTQDEAFFVNVGFDVTMTQADIDAGRLIVEIGAAPVKPAEFVIARISQKTREATS